MKVLIQEAREEEVRELFLASFASLRFKSIGSNRKDAKDTKNILGGAVRRVVTANHPSNLFFSNLLNKLFLRFSCIKTDT
jgi:hypothetical protein